MKILFEDNSIIVAVKPVGTASQKSPDGNDMVTFLERHTGCAIFPVHRLDTKTVGVMVYAKNKAAASFLSEEIAHGRFRKEYEAVVHGRPENSSGIMEDLLFKDSRKNKSYVVKSERKGVKKASLEYTVKNTFMTDKGELSLVHIKLHTGRTHQIRVQFASRKMPVFGDGKYGASDNVPYIALASCLIAFRHPVTGEYAEFSPTFNIYSWNLPTEQTP